VPVTSIDLLITAHEALGCGCPVRCDQGRKFTNPVYDELRFQRRKATCPESRFRDVSEERLREEKSSADKVMRMPISKQRNKHIQRMLIEAAKLAPSESHELALTHARELERGNRNRATLSVARKMVCYMFAVERRHQDFVPAEVFSRTVAV
jgi:hypothetical protein